MLRPQTKVVPNAALIPRACLIVPAPNQFTHQLQRRQAYYYGELRTAHPAGYLEKGTKVVLMVHADGALCRVVDARGLYVLTSFAGLKKLT